MERFCYLPTVEKGDIFKSFHHSKEILPYIQEEMAKMVIVAAFDKRNGVVIGKLLGLLLFISILE